MPAIKLYGRRWHFGTDIIPLPAALAFTFHFSWVVIMLVGAAATGQWPSHCESWEGVSYTILFGLYFGSFAIACIIDALLFYHAVKGAPFEETKRKMVVPLLYVGTGPLLIQAAATLYGTWVSVDLEPDCWENGGNTRNAVTNFAKALVFINWGFCFLALIGIAIFYNMYPDVHQEENWEQRCGCIATLLCCRQQVENPVDKGRRPPLKNIAELAAGILSHVDVDATDLAAAVVLTSAAQQRRRRLRIAKALLPVYRTLREGQRQLHEQQQQNAARNGIETSERGGDYLYSAFDPGSLFEGRERDEIEEQEEESDVTVEEERITRRGRRGRKKRRQRGNRSKFYDDDDGSGWVPSDPKLTRALTLAREASLVQPSQRPPPRQQPPPTAVAAETKTLDLTTSNVAALNTVQKLEQLEEEGELEGEVEQNNSRVSLAGAAGGGVKGMTRAAAELVADEITTTTSHQETSPADTIDQLAAAIQQEVEQLGEGPIEESVLTIRQQDSLDLTNIRIDPGNPMIWVHPNKIKSSSDVEANSDDVFSDARSLSSTISREISVHVEGSHHGEEKFSKAEEGAVVNTNSSVEREEATSALTAVVEEARDTADGYGGGDLEDNKSTRSSSPSEEEHPKLPLERQITLQHPTFITPSAHVENFTGPLTPEAIAEIYAGRHENVPAAILKSASSFLRYAYAAYALNSGMEDSASNHCLNCLRFAPPDPQSVVFKSLSALGGMVSDELVEILHLNCSNRVLSHLPYLIALDHAERAVVISIRGTIGITDLVTDAVVHPEKIDDWLPCEVAEKLGGTPALAHAGMVAAARAVFEDMTERGILRELVHGQGEEAALADLTRGSRGRSGSERRPPTQQSIHRNDNSSNGPKPNFLHCEEYRKQTANEDEDENATGAGRKVGDIMRRKLEEGWQFVVVGHSLGAGAASLISLKLRHYYPQLKCFAFSCPGGLVNKKLSHAMTSFCTSIAVGKDCIPRSSVATIARLMDELVTSLARCKQPKIKVLFLPWWRRHSQRFKYLFYDYDDIPEEAAAALIKYYESRRRLGQPIEMYPPGKIIFLRPIKSQSRLGQVKRKWDAVFIAAEDLMGEGILVSPNMLKDHLCSTAYDALNEAKEKAEAAEEMREGGGDGTQGEGVFEGVLRGAGRVVKAPWSVVQGAAQAWGGQPARTRQGSLEQNLINAV